MRAVLHQADLPAIDVRSVQFVHSALHVRVGAELDHALVGALFVGVGICDLPCLAHEVLEVLPAATTGQVLHNQPVLGADGRPILVSARASPAAVTTTTAFKGQGRHS